MIVCVFIQLRKYFVSTISIIWEKYNPRAIFKIFIASPRKRIIIAHHFYDTVTFASSGCGISVKFYTTQF